MARYFLNRKKDKNTNYVRQLVTLADNIFVNKKDDFENKDKILFENSQFIYLNIQGSIYLIT